MNIRARRMSMMLGFSIRRTWSRRSRSMAGMIDWTMAASIASAISAVAAAVSAYLSYRSILLNAQGAKEQRASQAMLQYVDLSLRHPKLSTSRKGEDYEWYVIAVLETDR